MFNLALNPPFCQTAVTGWCFTCRHCPPVFIFLIKSFALSLNTALSVVVITQSNTPRFLKICFFSCQFSLYCSSPNNPRCSQNQVLPLCLIVKSGSIHWLAL